MPHYCNITNCKHNENQVCIAGITYHVDRRCVTFRRKPKSINYRELMQPDVGICHRERGKMKSDDRGVLK